MMKRYTCLAAYRLTDLQAKRSHPVAMRPVVVSTMNRSISFHTELDMGRVNPRVGLGWVQFCMCMWVNWDDTLCYAKCNCKVYISWTAI